MWEANVTTEPRTLVDQTPVFQDCAFSPGGSEIISAGGREIMVWDARTGTALFALPQGVVTPEACLFTPDGSRIVSADMRTLAEWDARTGARLRSFEVHEWVGHRDQVTDCAVSPDGRRILFADADGTLTVWDVERWELLGRLEGHADPVNACAFSPDGSLIASVSGSRSVPASEDRTFRLWDARTALEVASLRLLGAGLSVALHPCLPLGACGDRTGALYLIDLVGIEYGPIIVTAVDGGGGPGLRCPKCFQVHRLQKVWLGEVINCPTDGCGLRLQVNSFMAMGLRKPWWRRTLRVR
jgi:hypothetical protein